MAKTNLFLILVLLFSFPGAYGQSIDPKTVELTAQGSGYYRVYVDDVEVSKHTTEREAAERAVRELAGNPGSSVRFVHDYSVVVTASTVQPTPVPDPDPDPIPDPDPDPVPDPDPIPEPSGDYLTVADFELIGGAKIAQDFPRGGLTIDFENNRLYTQNHVYSDSVCEYKWQPISNSPDIANWPVLERLKVHPRYWTGPSSATARDFEIRDGILWASPRVFYDMNPAKLTLSGKNLETGEIIHLPTDLWQGKFGGGFVEGHPTDWLVGNGGYESGQGSAAGPTVARIELGLQHSGTILLDQPNHGIMDFAKRTPRPPNYEVASDSWVGLVPRDIDGDGELEGAWCSDHVNGGGLWTPRGVLFWCSLGTGVLDYAFQSEAFAKTGFVKSYLYVYDPVTYKLISYEPWPHGLVHGNAIGPDGTIYLLTRRAWKSGLYQEDSAVKAFKLKEPQPVSKKLLEGKHLELVGGFRVGMNPVGSQTMRHAGGSIDKLPGTNRWVFNHFAQGKRLIELIEPPAIGTGSPSTWPMMVPGSIYNVSFNESQMRALGASWLDDRYIISSGKANYRKPYDPQFISIFDTSTNTTQKITVASSSVGNPEQGFGGGFTRSPDGEIYLACGGYEQLGSPFGPSLARRTTEADLQTLIYFPEQNKETRDSAYWWPGGSNPAFWQPATGSVGYWNGAECSFGAAWIDHPELKGIAYVAPMARGPIDYRAQGDTGGTQQFTIHDPKRFFTHLAPGAFLGHSDNWWAADSPPGLIGHCLFVYDPDQLSEGRKPWEIDNTFSEFPIDGLPMNLTHSGIKGITWDGDRDLLWVSIVGTTLGSDTAMVLAAYRLVADDTRPEPSFVLHPGYEFAEDGSLSVIGLQSSSYNGLSFENNIFTWVPRKESFTHTGTQLRYRETDPLGSYSVISSVPVDQTTYTLTDASPGWYMVTHTNELGQVCEVAGKVFIQ